MHKHGMEICAGAGEDMSMSRGRGGRWMSRFTRVGWKDGQAYSRKTGRKAGRMEVRHSGEERASQDDSSCA